MTKRRKKTYLQCHQQLTPHRGSRDPCMLSPSSAQKSRTPSYFIFLDFNLDCLYGTLFKLSFFHWNLDLFQSRVYPESFEYILSHPRNFLINQQIQTGHLMLEGVNMRGSILASGFPSIFQELSANRGVRPKDSPLGSVGYASRGCQPDSGGTCAEDIRPYVSQIGWYGLWGMIETARLPR